MRLSLAALPLLLAACGQPAPVADSPPAEASAPQTAPLVDNAAFAALPAETATGQWFFRGDEGVLAAGFGVPQSEFQFTVTCRQGDGAVTIMSGHELQPDQPTTLTLITERATLALPANSFNEGLPNVTAELAGDTELARAVAAALGETQTRFGVSVADQAYVYPWSAELTRALANCR